MMEEIFNKNLTLIKANRPILYRRLEPYLHDTKAWLEKESCGSYNLLIREQNNTVVKLYRQSIENEYQRSLDLSILKYPRILFFDGMGLGYHVFKFLQSRPESVRDIVIVEKNPITFINALKIHDFSSWIISQDFHFFIDLKESEMIPVMREYFLHRSRLIYSDRCEHFYFSPSLERDGEYYLNFSKAIKAAVERLIGTYAAPSEDNFRGLLNIIGNITNFKKSASLHCLNNLFKGKPGLVIAAGPSLDQHLQSLEQHQDRFVIACSDGALKTVIKHGIKPHFVCSMERDLETWSLFQGISQDYDVPLVTQPIIHPHVYENYPGPVVMFSRDCSFGKWIFPKIPQFFLGSSVAHMAYRALVLMGCSRIFLLGQDLARDRYSLKTHTQEVADIQKKYTEKLLSESTYCEVEGNDGTPIPSTIFWRLFITDYEYLIAQMKIPCVNVIQKTQGAKISGAELVEPEKFWQQVIEYPCFDAKIVLTQALSNGPRLNDEGASFVTIMSDTVNFLKKVEAACLDLMTEISRKFLEDCPVLGTEDDLKRYQNYFSCWEKKQEAIIDLDREKFVVFLFCLFSPEHVRILSSREALLRDTPIHYIMGYIKTTQEWLSTLHLWSCRARHLLEARMKE